MHAKSVFLALSILHFSSASSKVSFKDIPDCARQSCFPFHSASIGCSSFTKDCFCTQSLAPLQCAYRSCNNTAWPAVEDWFAGVCPNPPVVDFQVVPECGRACVRSELVLNGCPVFYSDPSDVDQFNRNCFCRLGSNSTLQQSCLTAAVGCGETALEANNTLTLFYQQNCVYVQNNADQNDQQPTGDQVVQSASDSTGSVGNVGLWLGILGSIVGLAGFVSGIIIWFKRAVSFAKHPVFGFLLTPLSVCMQKKLESGRLTLLPRTASTILKDSMSTYRQYKVCFCEIGLSRFPIAHRSQTQMGHP
jgi:hypothetical protein